jgi:hypothetical protein
MGLAFTAGDLFGYAGRFHSCLLITPDFSALFLCKRELEFGNFP